MLQLRLSLNLELELHHGPSGRYGVQTRVILIKRRGESLRHVVMKLLGYLWFYHEELQIERSVDQHHKPDLVRVDEQGRPLQWVDCGQTSLRKLERISQRNRLTLIDIIKATPGELASYRLQAMRRLSHPERVRYWSVQDDGVARLEAALHGRHAIIATLDQDMRELYMLIDGQSLRLPICFMPGEDP